LHPSQPLSSVKRREAHRKQAMAMKAVFFDLGGIVAASHLEALA
jgi:hypothetical protein